MKISFFETRTGILFYQSRVSRREREIENDFSGSSEKKISWFSREFPGTGIPVTLWFKQKSSGCNSHGRVVMKSIIDDWFNSFVILQSTGHPAGHLVTYSLLTWSTYFTQMYSSRNHQPQPQPLWRSCHEKQYFDSFKCARKKSFSTTASCWWCQ